jgi:hypothetical protein
MAGQGMNIKGKFMPLNSGPADAQDSNGSKQDVNPFISGRLGITKKKKGKLSPAMRDAAKRRLAKMNSGKKNGNN